MYKQKNIRVLITEDDPLVSAMVGGLLEEIGYTVVGKAANGIQAVEMTKSLRPDIVLMDIDMPQMNGLQASRRIYDECPTPVVALTAYQMPEMIEEAGAAGVGAYLLKPPDMRQLERAITIALARFEDMKRLRNLNRELQSRNEELQAALHKVQTLSGLLPICASCKSIRDDRGYWQQVESYISEYTRAEFTHGLCPDCMRELYPDVYQQVIKRKEDIIQVVQELGRADLSTIAGRVDLPESNTQVRLNNLVDEGQLKEVTINDRVLYEQRPLDSSSVLEFYNQLAEDYHLIYADWSQSVRQQGHVLDRLIQEQLGHRPHTLLDCACGIGTQALGLALRGYTVHATDISPEAIERAAREADRLAVSLTFGVADMRHLATQVEGTFEAIIACDNALPHLLTRDELSQAIHNMKAKLEPDGLLLVSIRNYDHLLADKPRTTPPRIYEDGQGQRIVFQVWHWHTDKPRYRLDQFILKEVVGSWQVRHYTTEYRALLRHELNTILEEIGFVDIYWYTPADSAYHQPVVTARKPGAPA